MTVSEHLAEFGIQADVLLLHYNGSHLQRAEAASWPGTNGTVFLGRPDSLWECVCATSPVENRADALDLTLRLRLTQGADAQAAAGLRLTVFSPPQAPLI